MSSTHSLGNATRKTLESYYVNRLAIASYIEEVWHIVLCRQLDQLFDRDVKTIGKHINNALAEELSGFPVVAKFATTATDGKTYMVEFYNLEMILSVGYRVKSQRGIYFRRWANTILKNHLLRGYAVASRFDIVERQLEEHRKILDAHERQIDFFVRTSLPPVEGIFYDGQIFDAYVFATDLIRSARLRLVLIDNYVDESVLLMLSKRTAGVSAEIRTGRMSQQLQLDIEKHNSQYEPIRLVRSHNIHDRFLIVDDTVYHLGASLKDLGRKLFAFSKMSLLAEILLGEM